MPSLNTLHDLSRVILRPPTTYAVDGPPDCGVCRGRRRVMSVALRRTLPCPLCLVQGEMETFSALWHGNALETRNGGTARVLYIGSDQYARVLIDGVAGDAISIYDLQEFYASLLNRQGDRLVSQTFPNQRPDGRTESAFMIFAKEEYYDDYHSAARTEAGPGQPGPGQPGEPFDEDLARLHSDYDAAHAGGTL